MLNCQDKCFPHVYSKPLCSGGVRQKKRIPNVPFYLSFSVFDCVHVILHKNLICMLLIRRRKIDRSYCRFIKKKFVLMTPSGPSGNFIAWDSICGLDWKLGQHLFKRLQACWCWCRMADAFKIEHVLGVYSQFPGYIRHPTKIELRMWAVRALTLWCHRYFGCWFLFSEMRNEP